jgi:hypothetical protein
MRIAQAGALGVRARLLDQVLATGVPLEIERNGRRLRVVADPPPSKLDRLVPHPGTVIGDPEDLVEMDPN